MEQGWLPEVAEGNTGISGEDGGRDSYRIWSTGEGGRIGYGDDQKSDKWDARVILVTREVDDRDRI